MTLDQLIAQLEDVRKEHGGQVEVVARRFGDYLESDPTLRVERLGWSSWAHRWDEYDCDDLPPSRTATVVFLEH